MGLIPDLKNFNYVFIVCILFYSNPQSVYSAGSSLQEIRQKHSLDKILVITIDKDISLDDLILSSGYSLEDENTQFLLKDFMRLNAFIKSISVLKKGTVIRLPLSYLKRIEGRTGKTYASTAIKRGKKKTFRKKDIKKTAVVVFTLDKSIILGNIKTLFQSLGDNISIETEGFKIFDIGEKSELSLDKTFFPLIDLHNERILVFDYKGILSEELKNLLEISWPEFRIVSYKEGMDLKQLVYFLLRESGYSVKKSEKLVVGGRNQIEYYPDFLVFRENDDFIDSQLSFVSIIDHNAKKTPDSLVAWLNNRGIRLIELSNQETEKYDAGCAPWKQETIHERQNRQF